MCVCVCDSGRALPPYREKRESEEWKKRLRRHRRNCKDAVQCNVCCERGEITGRRKKERKKKKGKRIKIGGRMSMVAVVNGSGIGCRILCVGNGVGAALV